MATATHAELLAYALDFCDADPVAGGLRNVVAELEGVRAFFGVEHPDGYFEDRIEGMVCQAQARLEVIEVLYARQVKALEARIAELTTKARAA
jgi:hypothetical protein